MFFMYLHGLHKSALSKEKHCRQHSLNTVGSTTSNIKKFCSKWHGEWKRSCTTK